MTTDEALRVVGHLLEHHGTQGAWARDERGEALPYGTHHRGVCWCLSAAVRLVALDVLKTNSSELQNAAQDLLQVKAPLHRAWDTGADSWRAQEWRAWAVERLKTAGLT